jgi:predicted tellurium resistance membrane protein TerC
MKYRIGCFIAILGLLSLVTFAATIQAAEPEISLLCAGMLILAVGAALMVRGYQKPPPSGRFSTVNKFRDRQSKPKNPKKGQ